MLSLQVECGGNSSPSKVAQEMSYFGEGNGKNVEVTLGEVDT